MHLYVTRDVVTAIRPRLLGDAHCIDAWAAEIVDQAEARVALEAATWRRSPFCCWAARSSGC